MDRGARRTPRRPTRLPFRSLASERVANRAIRHRRVSADRGIVLLDAAASAPGWISRTPDRDLSSAPSQRARLGEAISGSDVGRGDSSRPASRRVVCVAAAWDLVERSCVCGPLRIPMGYGPTVWDRGGSPAVILCGHPASVRSVFPGARTSRLGPAAQRHPLARSPTRDFHRSAGGIPRGGRHASAGASASEGPGDSGRLVAPGWGVLQTADHADPYRCSRTRRRSRPPFPRGTAGLVPGLAGRGISVSVRADRTSPRRPRGRCHRVARGDDAGPSDPGVGRADRSPLRGPRQPARSCSDGSKSLRRGNPRADSARESAMDSDVSGLAIGREDLRFPFGRDSSTARARRFLSPRTFPFPSVLY